MSKSLAELRASGSTGLPRRAYQLCLANTLLAEMQSLTNELLTLETPRADPDAPGPPKRVNGTPRAAEIHARITELDAELDEHTGELVLQGVEGGVWSRWVDEHPLREEGQRGYSRDLRITAGYCNADDLLAALGDYVHTWNGEALGDGDWEFIKSKAAPGDLNELARLVVIMHETAVDLPKLRANWREGLMSESD